MVELGKRGNVTRNTSVENVKREREKQRGEKQGIGMG